MSESASSSRTYSSVWSHFTLLEEEGKAQCNYCGTKYKRSGERSFREFLVKWIVCDDQLFVVVKCEYLRKLFCLLNPNAKSLSADTIHNDIMKSFKDEKNKIQEILQNAPGRLSFTLDALLSGPHSGKNLYETFEHCCDDMRILTKIMAITTDNTSNNDTLIKMVQDTCKNRNIEFTASNNHVRCLAHVINLAIQDALSNLKVGYVESENDILNNNAEIRDVIPKLRKLVVKIRSSP
ncbi:unnamed protein product [Rhizophagus irregularis]|uniref:BED-type domain-containing protein n=1 Tax=Rhizophagus irregularis TaxID=588596 RepID=A0A915ZBR7_9GLOM|nr:unnamed protein product [Rhizophagus irregularis]